MLTSKLISQCGFVSAFVFVCACLCLLLCLLCVCVCVASATVCVVLACIQHHVSLVQTDRAVMSLPNALYQDRSITDISCNLITSPHETHRAHEHKQPTTNHKHKIRTRILYYARS